MYFLTPVYQKPWYDLQLFRYIVWQTETGNFGSFFCTFTPLKPNKSEFWKNKKKMLEITSFYRCAPKTTIIWGTVPLIWFLSIIKWKKNPWRYHYFAQVYQKSWAHATLHSDMLCDRLFLILGYFLHFYP